MGIKDPANAGMQALHICLSAFSDLLNARTVVDRLAIAENVDEKRLNA